MPALHMICRIPGCTRSSAESHIDHANGAMCEQHLSLASPAARESLNHARQRVERLEKCWQELEKFSRIVAKGRYLQLSALTEMAHERLDRAWERAQTEVMRAVTGREASRAPAPNKASPKSRSAPGVPGRRAATGS